MNRTYAGQRGHHERATVSIPPRSGLSARDSVTSDVTGSWRLPGELNGDVGVGDDERVAKMQRRAWRTLHYQHPSVN